MLKSIRAFKERSVDMVNNLVGVGFDKSWRLDTTVLLARITIEKDGMYSDYFSSESSS